MCTKIHKAFSAALGTFNSIANPEVGGGREEVMLSLLTLKKLKIQKNNFSRTLSVYTKQKTKIDSNN